MNIQWIKTRTLCVSAAVMMGIPIGALATQHTTSPNADNTAVNVRDQGTTGTLTPTDQSRGSKRDIEITRQIRREITQEEKFSINARNIKIITLNGVVTLRGPVQLEDERARIVGIAKNIAGTNRVVSELQIAP